MPDTKNSTSWISATISRLSEVARIPNQIGALRDLLLADQTRALQQRHINPLNAFGRKCFSQTDEDGITLEILRRLGRLEAGVSGVYAEFGVGNGTENNTLVLAALGWKGYWVGGETLRPSLAGVDPCRFSYLRNWITLENIRSIATRGMQEICATQIDLISIDLDGNDIYLVEELLKLPLRPLVFIVEYNSKFPPPVQFQIAYDANHTWQGDDYFGASLSSFDTMFKRFGYRLVCCNSHSGANAFFVDANYSSLFEDVPSDIREIYVEPRFHLYKNHGHPVSLRTIEQVLRSK